MSSYKEVFNKATGLTPYPYQERLAAAPRWPELLDIPTGLGKTAAVVLAWVWKRRFCVNSHSEEPRRLIYVLPVRSLVEQTLSSVRLWLANLELLADAGEGGISAHPLTGGSVDRGWEDRPEADCVLVGTLDMLLSRALNRGYGMSRYAWPLHFGLLNCDALWVLDETQLMGVAVQTSAQLHAFRRKLGAPRPTASIWMSATLSSRQLDTIDNPPPPTGRSTVRLMEEDRRVEAVSKRVQAGKELSRVEDVWIDKSTGKAELATLAEAVAKAHRADGLTLAIVNRVSRAQSLYRAVKDKSNPATPVALVHSRFRPVDRRAHQAILLGSGDRIVVSTQAVEAGVDVSARDLFTELAPWSSLVQRFGRCNRHGEYPDARVHWIDVRPADDKDPVSLPYPRADLEEARPLLAGLRDAGPDSVARASPAPPTPCSGRAPSRPSWR